MLIVEKAIKTINYKFLLFACFAASSFQVHAVTFDQIQVGLSSYQFASNALKSIAQAALRKAFVMEQSAPLHRSDQGYSIASFAQPLGELQADMIAVAAKKGIVTYIRYHVPSHTMQNAIALIAQKYQNNVLEIAESDETGPNNWFFVSKLDVTWISKPDNPKSGLEIIVVSHDELEKILTEEYRAFSDEWIPQIRALRGKSKV